MFKVGEFVKIKKNVIDLGRKYKFRITNVKEASNPAFINVYKIERDKQCSLDPLYGPYDYQLKKIYEIEDRIWREDELELATVDLSDKIMNCPTVSISVSGNVLQSGKEICTINKKEEKEMEILKLYEGRKGEEIAKNYRKEREKILKEDEIQSIIIEMENQVNTILENQNLRGRLKVNEEELHTANTEEKLEELRKSTDAERAKLRSTLDEIRALFEMTDSYEERIKILKNYGIVGDNGRVNA